MHAVKDHIFAFEVAFEKLSKGRFWTYIIPSLVVAILFYGIFSFIGGLSEGAEVASGIPLLGDYIVTGVQKTLSLVDALTFQLYKFFILTILSPVNCLLSEKTDNELTGARFSGGITRIITDLFRALLLVLFALLLNLLAMGAWWLIAKITGFHLLDNVIYFLTGAFFLGFSFYDYSLERYGMSFAGTIRFGFDHIPHMLLTGVLFSLIFMIPVAGIIFAPFLLTILSTIVYVRMTGRIPHQTTNSIQQ